MSLISTASSGRERLTRAGAMSGEVAQVARPTAVDVPLQQFGWQSAVVEQRWPGVWMSSGPAHQHASTKASPDSQASRRHRSASSGSQQRRRAAFSRPVCSREMSREDPSSGDMVCQAAVDGLYTIDGACGIRGLCTGETEAQHRRFIHAPR